MKKIKFGATDLEISPIGLGTVKFGRNLGVKFPQPFELPSDKHIQDILKYAQDLGINTLDTAPAYGQSEERIGKLLPGPRQDWIIFTKVGEEFIDNVSHHNFTPEEAQASIERSLQRLNTDYLDGVLVHSDGNDIRIIQEYGLLDFLSHLKQKGWIRSFGMSVKTVEGGMLAVKKCDMLMVTYHPLYTEELCLIQEALKLNKGILVKKALMSGHIQHLPGNDPVQYSLNFVSKTPGVHSILLGTINPSHLAHAVNSVFV